MQYRIDVAGLRPNLEVIEQAITSTDPAALVDVDQSGEVLRVSTLLDDAELLDLLSRTGLHAETRRLQRVPSECCGGCGG